MSRAVRPGYHEYPDCIAVCRHNPGQPGGEMKFCTDPNSTQTSHNVVATVPGDKAYSPLWLRVVYDSAACASVHNLDTALKAKVVPARVLLINCPIVSIEH